MCSQRVVDAMRTAAAGYGSSAEAAVGTAVFTVGAEECVGADGMVVVGNIETCSTSTSTLFPLLARLHIGYVPSAGRVLGLSKLARIAEVYARRLQSPHALARSIASAVQEQIAPKGVAVRLHAKQLHPMGSSVSEHTACLGCMLDPSSGRRDEFEGLLRVQMQRHWYSSRDRCSQKRAPSSSDSDALLCAPAALEAPDLKARRLDSLLRVDGVQRAAQHERMRDAVERMLRDLDIPEDRETLRQAADGYISCLLDATAGHELSAAKLVRPPPRCEQNPRRDLRGGELAFYSVHVNSTCEHHLLPFFGSAVLGVPIEATANLGQDALQGLVDIRALRLQVQERLTEEIGEQLYEAACSVANASNCDVIVALEASHMCMVARGVEKAASCTSSVAAFGSLRNSPTLRADALGRAMESDAVAKAQ